MHETEPLLDAEQGPEEHNVDSHLRALFSDITQDADDDSVVSPL